MKKALTALCSIAVIIGVFSASAFGHGSHGGRGHHGWHGKKKHALVFSASLSPVTSATGATTSKKAKRARHGVRGHSSRTSGPRGVAAWTQTSSKYRLGVVVKGLAASTDYKVAVYVNSDGQGCASTTNGALAGLGTGTLTTNSRGYGFASAKGAVSEASLSPDGSYYVSVTDASGSAVVCGKLKLRSGHRHRGGCGSGHGPTGATGSTDVSGVAGRSAWSHH
ncbi:MAG: hypothetical protein QM648_00750 [Solirubrobacterales bacterium]